MISNELLEEVINISLKEEIIDQDLLMKIIYSVVDNCSDRTRANFNGVEMFKEFKREKLTNADYIEEYKIIRVFYLNIVKNGLLRKNLNVFKTNLYMLQVILHEIEHLKSDTKELTDDFESKLIKNSSATFIWELIEDNLNEFLLKHKTSIIINKYLQKKYELFTFKTWDVCPDEKLAEAYSNEILIDSINKYYNFKEKYPKEYEYALKTYLNGLLTGYKFLKNKDEYNIPLIQYLDAINNIDVLNKVDESIKEEIKNADKYSLEERIKYGLPIEKDSIKVLMKKYQLDD